MDFPASIARALAIPANDETGSIHDVKHVVVMMQGRSFDIFREDVLADRLPQVSWIVAPEAYTEHGNWPSNFGAWYVSQMLDALTANPEVCSKTVFFYMFDENDGFFDHMVPPTPPQLRAQGISTAGTTNELFTGSATYPASVFTPGPYGHGVRVPMIIISPWSEACDFSARIAAKPARSLKCVRATARPDHGRTPGEPASIARFTDRSMP